MSSSAATLDASVAWHGCFPWATSRARPVRHEGPQPTVENAVQQFVSVFEKKLDDLAARGRDAKRQTAEELAPLRRDLDTYIDILEKSIEAQFDMARRQEIRRLLTTAQAKRTRISNVINRRAANDG
jgi:hypothetical protein